MIEELVAISVIVLVGGAVVGIVIKALRGNKSDDDALAKITSEFKAQGGSKAKK